MFGRRKHQPWAQLIADVTHHFDVAASYGMNASFGAERAAAASKLIKEMARILDDEMDHRAKVTQLRHLRRHAIYDVVGNGTLQVSSGLQVINGRKVRLLEENDTLVIYRSREDGKYYLRPPEEFTKDRFSEESAP